MHFVPKMGQPEVGTWLMRATSSPPGNQGKKHLHPLFRLQPTPNMLNGREQI